MLANEQNRVFAHETSLFSDPIIIFKERGLNQVLSFPGFCEKHDGSLFKTIEKTQIDFKNWRNLHLLCYRTELNERRKKEIVIKTHERVLADRNLTNKMVLGHKRDLVEQIRGNRLGIQDSGKTISDLLEDLKDDKQLYFEHFVREMPHTGVCVCGVFNLETTADQYYHKQLSGKEYDYLSSIFIHLIPITKETDVLTITYEKRMEDRVRIYLRNIFGGSNDDARKQLSDLLFLQVENWICSKQFYLRNIKTREKYIAELMERTIDVWDENSSTGFNIFEN